ncbi:MAG TPA: hypothetical protein VES66_04145 [Terriglobales bacterium]|nr:hypothetical protein [Terriglobales bacterium]
MRRSAQLTFLRVLCLIFSLALPAVAGQLFPCPRAVSSSNGNFLVLSDVQFEHGQGLTARVKRVSLQVFSKEHFINAKDRLTTPATYWTDGPQWDVVLASMPMHNEPECPVPLITDDGEFMVLLRIGMVASGEDAVLQIYRWDHRSPDHHGVFVKDIALKEIWKTPGMLGQNLGTWTDGTPEWFAGGTFEFSSDCRQLIHKTRFGNTVRVNLQDGSVSGN